MATNKYFQTGKGPGTNSERDLVESNLIEMIQLSGLDVCYIPKEKFAADNFFREVPNEKYLGHKIIEMYMASVNDFGGQGDFMSKFGLEINDTAEFVCARARYSEEFPDTTPKTGDLLYLPLTKHLFQIDYVEDEPGTTVTQLNQFYSLSKLYSYVFKCSLYTYSYETFDTGIDDIDTELDRDDFADAFGNNEQINTEAADALDFSEDNPFGEIVED